ncbi:uncharacterized protein LOC132730179 [Ruditapes philippinarum]|uniref:uncharacterized protein LOC132730179 n=1 Tax=Ruditapes philippinarum TaxID=129788 RepID=UPI00295BC8A6|nr:uncharacterized protein LOC132730179 [Ruditapes philippinarum]
MEIVRELTCLILTIAPVICTSRDSNAYSNLKLNLRMRTDNSSDDILGQQSEFYLRDKYFDMLAKLTKSYGNSNMPLESMQRTLRSFDPDFDFLTSAKREKEEYENLQNLQYYGTEIPKKFTVKRLFSPKSFSWIEADDSFGDTPVMENVDRAPIMGNLVKRSGVSEPIKQHRPNSYSTDEQPQLSNNPLSFNPPKLTNEQIQSMNRKLYLETARRLNTSKVHDNGEKSMNANGIPISKRPSQFEPDVCNMDDVNIDVRFHEMMETEAGLLSLVCTGSIVVNKCEGACNSYVKPSVNNYDGFERRCFCCKDSSIRSRRVTLSVCTLGPEEVHGYSISRTIVEPTACSCQECRN